MANKRKKTNVSYEPEADVLSWEVSRKPIDYAQEAGNMIVHFSKDHVPVFIELLEASKFFTATEKLMHVRKPSMVGIRV